MVLTPVLEVCERPAGAVTMTTRLPTTALALALMVAVSVVPPAFTLIFEAVIFGSSPLASLKNRKPVAPDRLLPLIVMETGLPLVMRIGAMLLMTALPVTETLVMAGNAFALAGIAPYRTNSHHQRQPGFHHD